MKRFFLILAFFHGMPAPAMYRASEIIHKENVTCSTLLGYVTRWFCEKPHKEQSEPNKQLEILATYSPNEKDTIGWMTFDTIDKEILSKPSQNNHQKDQ